MVEREEGGASLSATPQSSAFEHLDGFHGSQPVARDLSAVFASNAGTQLVAIVRSVSIPLIIAPALYGAWRLVLLVWQYGAYLHLGSFALLNRELPVLLDQSKRSQFVELRQTALWGTLTVAVISAFGVLTYLVWYSRTSPELVALATCVAGLIFLQLSLYVQVQLRVESQFGQMSLQAFVEAVSGLVLMIPLGILLGLPGLVIGLVLATGLAALLFAKRDMFDRPRLNASLFIRQAAEGAPISSLPFLNATISSVGQVIAAGLLGIEAAGYYGIGVLMGAVVYAVPNATGLVLYPRYLKSFARGSDAANIRHLVRRSVRLTTVTCVSAVALTAICLAPLYRDVFPKYVGARVSSYILIAMMPFVAYSLVLQNALIALRRQALLIVIQLFAVGLSGVLALLGAYVFHSLSALATGVLIANLVSGCATLWLAFSATAPDRGQAFREVLAELAPLAGMAVIVSTLIVVQSMFTMLATWPIVLSEALLLSIGCVGWAMHNFPLSLKSRQRV